MNRRALSSLPTVLAVAFVLFAYWFFGSAGKLTFPTIHWTNSY